MFKYIDLTVEALEEHFKTSFFACVCVCVCVGGGGGGGGGVGGGGGGGGGGVRVRVRVCVFILFHCNSFFRLQRCLGHT